MKSTRTYRRWVGRVTLGLAVAAIAAPSAQAYYFDEVGTGANVPSTGPAGPTVVPTDMVAGLPSIDELQQFRFTPNSEPAGPTLTHPFSFQPSAEPVPPTLTHPFSFQPSNEPVGPTVVVPDPTRGLPSLDDLQQFRFQPNEPEAPVAVPTSGPRIDWTDAGIGAGIAIAAMLLAMAAALGLRRNRRLAHS
jgi:hypothetical protein